jgi:hypothetical protein
MFAIVAVTFRYYAMMIHHNYYSYSHRRRQSATNDDQNRFVSLSVFPNAVRATVDDSSNEESVDSLTTMKR